MKIRVMLNLFWRGITLLWYLLCVISSIILIVAASLSALEVTLRLYVVILCTLLTCAELRLRFLVRNAAPYLRYYFTRAPLQGLVSLLVLAPQIDYVSSKEKGFRGTAGFGVLSIASVNLILSILCIDRWVLRHPKAVNMSRRTDRSVGFHAYDPVDHDHDQEEADDVHDDAVDDGDHGADDWE
eukprot:TRINITY_DN80289_c0_g1_i1.p1 TRINITY_DN80289_c0_g1~~TRINITY_DN80289_c0_g1_i1.p1  ORF type:complete len:184 (+),score=44.49 TRINITY_DN80289_c0_g1_i1:75-626(+)